MKIENVLVVGTGNMGQQIALQHAMHGYNVTVQGRREAGLVDCEKQHEVCREDFMAAYPEFSNKDFDAALARISYTTDLQAAAARADLVTESVTENLELKQQIFSDLERFCPAYAILTTNTSTMLPSSIATVLNAPERFLALHYSSPVWSRPMAEVMRLPATSDAVFEQVIEFAKASGMVPLRLETEHPGYILNSFLAPLAFTALGLLAKGVATHQDIDRTWLLNFPGMGVGPCGLLDQMGFNSLLAVAQVQASADPENLELQALVGFIQTQFVDKGLLGTPSGQGLYSYPNPEYMELGFIGR